MTLLAILHALSFTFSPLPQAVELRSLVAISVQWEPATLVNGSPCLFHVTSEQTLKSLSGKWFGERVFFNFNVRNSTWYGLAGIGLEMAAGQQTLTLEAVTANGEHLSSNHIVKIGKAIHRTIALKVPRKFLEPDADTLERIKQEQTIKRETFNRVTELRQWTGNFIAPVNTHLADSFGTQRKFNRTLQSPHQGGDFQASLGTPVAAMNNGTVVLAREMFFEGGFVVIDHGQGLLTTYLHLSEIKVKEGDRVTKQQIIAASGTSGRSTGAHLHVGVRWQNVYVDPATLLHMEFPSF